MHKLEECKSQGDIHPFKLLQAGQLAECEAGLSLVNSLTELVEIAGYLKSNFPLDFRSIYDASKRLRTLGDPIRRLASEFLDENMNSLSHD